MHSRSLWYLSFTILLVAQHGCTAKDEAPVAVPETASVAAVAETLSMQQQEGVQDNPGLPSIPAKQVASTRLYLAEITNGIRDDSGAVMNFACGNSKRCNPIGDSIKLRIVPVRGAEGVDWKNATRKGSSRGFIVARVMLANSRHHFDKLDLSGREMAYLWVGPLDDGNPGIAFVKLSANGVRELGPVYPKQKFKHCRDKSRPGPVQRNKPHEDLKVCDDVPVGAGTIGIMMPDGPMWISCKDGCCEVNEN